MCMTSDVKQVPEERRQDARVHDAVGLHLQRLDKAAGDDVTGRSDRELSTASIVGSLDSAHRTATRRANKYAIEGYGDVRRNHPDVAAYIDALEERIRQLLLDGDPVETAPTHKVSLSAGGIAFADGRLFEPGEIIGVSLTLFPSARRVASDARIVSANDAPEVANGDRPNYRLEFVRMSDADRHALTAHIEALSGARRPVADEH